MSRAAAVKVSSMTINLMFGQSVEVFGERKPKSVTYRLIWAMITAAMPLRHFATKGRMKVKGVADQEK